MSITIFLSAMLFGLAETAYFGWNWLPKSGAEVICDGITLVIFALSFVAKKESNDE